MRPHQATPAPHMKGDNRRQRETTGDKTTSEPKKPTTPTNTHPPHEGRTPAPHMKGDNRRQRETRPLQSPRSRPHQPQDGGHTNPHEGRQPETTGDKTTSEPKKPTTPTNTHPPHEGRQPETTGDKTTSEPKMAATPTNTKAARSKVALRTPN